MNKHSERSVRMMVKVLLIVFTVIIFFMSDSTANAEHREIRKIWSSESHITWIGTIAGPIENLIITINNKPVASDKLILNEYTESVHVRIPLEYGVSSLVSVVDGDHLLFKEDLFYASTFEEELVPEEYEFNTFHTERNEEPCLACHRLEVQENDKQPVSPAESICFPCHKQKFSGIEFQHKAAGVNWECLNCHQAEAVETDYSINGPIKFVIMEGMAVAPLCYDCHKDKKQEHDQYKYVHGPVAMQGCIMCHDPHGSNDKNLLLMEVSTMCINCHDLQEMMEKNKVHKPLIKDGCTGCHDPHGSNSRVFLPRDIISTCYICHPKIEKLGNNHPIMGHPVSGPEDPVNHDRQFTCVSCHNPHSSEFDKFLAADEMMMLCIRCHINGNNTK